MGENKKEVLASIKGSEEIFDIKKDTIYKVYGRFDEGAPDGLQRLGISKIPFLGNGDRILCRFDELSEVYDTGLYASSMCYRGLPPQEAAKMAKKAKENIGDPYVKITGKNIEQSNYDFWDSFIVALNDDSVIFDTSNPVDAFKLYIAVLSRKLCPEELDGDPKYKDAFYRLIDTTTTEVFKNEYDLDVMNATATFVTMLNGDKEEEQAAKDIAIWLGFYDGSDLSKEYILLAFSNYLKADPGNCKSYSRAYTMYNSPVEYEILKICRMLCVLALRGVTELTKKGLMLGGRTLGKDRKSVADRCVNDKDMEKTKIAIIEAYDALVDAED